MKWKWIFLISLLGCLQTVIDSQEASAEIPSWILSLVNMILIPGSCAGLIAKRVDKRYFLHGFLVGACYTMIALIVFFAACAYIRGNVVLRIAEDRLTRDTLEKSSTTAVAGMLFFVTPLASIIRGFYLGVITWIFGKIKSRAGH